MRGKQFSPAEELEIIDLYEKKGLTLCEISKKYSVKYTKIKAILEAHGVESKGRRRNNRFLDDHYFEEIDTEEKAYFVGLLFADGSVCYDPSGKRAPSLSIELVETDVEILQRLKSELRAGVALVYGKRKNRQNGTYSLSIRSKKIVEDLEKYGIIQNKTQNTTSIPKNIPTKFLKDFLRGLIDGDGSIYFSVNAWHVNLCSHHASIIDDFQTLCRNAIGKKDPLAIQCSDGVYRVTFNGKWAKRLISFCYRDSKIGIARKHRLAMAVIEDKKVDDIV